jgi:hypothetical protein
VTADATVTEEAAADSITTTCRAFEELHQYGSMRLTVKVDDGYHEFHSQVEALMARIGSSPLLEIAASEQEAAVKVYFLPPRGGGSTKGPVPQMQKLDDASLMAVDRSGQVCLPICRVGEIDKLIDNLEQRARYLNVVDLYNPNEESDLKGKVSLTLLRVGADGTATKRIRPRRANYLQGGRANRLQGYQQPRSESLFQHPGFRIVWGHLSSLSSDRRARTAGGKQFVRCRPEKGSVHRIVHASGLPFCREFGFRIGGRR